MKRFRVEYQMQPYMHTTAQVMLIEAETRADAAVCAYVTLTERGYVVGFSDFELQNLNFNHKERGLMLKCGLPITHGKMCVTDIREYNVETKGKVLEG